MKLVPCTWCQEDFAQSNHRNVVCGACKDTHAYLDDKRKRHTAYTTQHYYSRLEAAKQYLGGKCVSCLTTEDLQFDHIEPRSLTRRSTRVITSMVTYSWTKLKVHLDQCQLLCKECHLQKTAHDIGRTYTEADSRATLCLCFYCEKEFVVPTALILSKPGVHTCSQKCNNRLRNRRKGTVLGPRPKTDHTSSTTERDSKNFVIATICYERGYRVMADGTLTFRGRQKTIKEDDGYMCFKVSIRNIEGRTHTCRVHVLLAIQKYGVDAVYRSQTVRHLNGNSCDNSHCNVVLGTHSDNCMDIPHHMRLQRSLHAAESTRKLTSLQVLEARCHYALNDYTLQELATTYGVCKTTMAYIVNKRTYNHF